jgi:uncharacterized membrane protein YphA (DoxX/SURF4 family)
MDIALWVVQGLLGFVFVMAGASKLTQPREKLLAQMQWVEDFNPNQIKAIGGVELLGALGLVLPMLLNILPILTPVAAAGLALTMVGAMLTHLRRKENQMIAVNVVLLLLAVFVAYGRFVMVPVA